MSTLSYWQKYEAAEEFLKAEPAWKDLNWRQRIWHKALSGNYFSKKKKEDIDLFYAYSQRRQSFAFKSAELSLAERYASEKADSSHLYPDSTDRVWYPDNDKDSSKQKISFDQGRLAAVKPFQGMGGDPGRDEPVSTDTHEGFMFVRSNSRASIRDKKTYVGIKKRQKFRLFQPAERTQHSSFKGGGDVVSAGYLQFDRGKLIAVLGESGHYKPNEASLYKFAEFGSQSGQFDPEKVKFYQRKEDMDNLKHLKMDLRTRAQVVRDWGQKNQRASLVP